MKPQNTANIGFFKGLVFLFLFSIPTFGQIFMILCAIFDKGDVGRFARILLIIDIVFGLVFVLIGFLAPQLFDFIIPEIVPNENDGVQAFVAGLIG